MGSNFVSKSNCQRRDFGFWRRRQNVRNFRRGLEGALPPKLSEPQMEICFWFRALAPLFYKAFFLFLLLLWRVITNHSFLSLESWCHCGMAKLVIALSHWQIRDDWICEDRKLNTCVEHELAVQISESFCHVKTYLLSFFFN